MRIRLINKNRAIIYNFHKNRYTWLFLQSALIGEVFGIALGVYENERN